MADIVQILNDDDIDDDNFRQWNLSENHLQYNSNTRALVIHCSS